VLRSLVLEQVGQVEVGAFATCERLASGHVLIGGQELEHRLLLDPTLGRVERLPRGVDAIHVGEGVCAETTSEGDLRLVARDGAELAHIDGRGDLADVRFGPSGAVLWEIGERRRWEVRARVGFHDAAIGRMLAEAELPEPHPELRAWAVEAVHPITESLVASSVERHVAVELTSNARALTVRPLAFESFVDWMPGGTALLATSFDGWLSVHRWPSGEVARRVGTARLRDLLDDTLGFHGRVIDDDRAIVDTERGRLVVVDLADPGAEVIELRLAGDARETDLHWLELGRTGRILTGRRDDRVLKIWDGTAAVRAIPARRVGLR